MLATVSFFSSLALLAAFFGFRWLEEKRTVRFFSAFRSAMDVRVARFYKALVMEEFSTAWRHALLVFIHKAAHHFVVVLVEALRAIERPLTRISHQLRVSRPSANGRGVSPFLRSIIRGKKDEKPENGTTPKEGV